MTTTHVKPPSPTEALLNPFISPTFSLAQAFLFFLLLKCSQSFFVLFFSTVWTKFRHSIYITIHTRIRSLQNPFIPHSVRRKHGAVCCVAEIEIPAAAGGDYASYPADGGGRRCFDRMVQSPHFLLFIDLFRTTDFLSASQNVA